MHRRGTSQTETKKRTPLVRLGRKILGHLNRWKAIDERAHDKACQEAGEPVAVFLHLVAYKGLPVAKVRTAWANAREMAELDDAVTPHVLRHTRATWMMQGGIDLWEAAGSLGMSPKTLTETYGHHHPDWQRKAAEI